MIHNRLCGPLKLQKRAKWDQISCFEAAHEWFGCASALLLPKIQWCSHPGFIFDFFLKGAFIFRWKLFVLWKFRSIHSLNTLKINIKYTLPCVALHCFLLPHFWQNYSKVYKVMFLRVDWTTCSRGRAFLKKALLKFYPNIFWIFLEIMQFVIGCCEIV